MSSSSLALRATFDADIDLTLDLIAAKQHSAQFVGTATLSLAQFIVRDECNTSTSSDRSEERLRDTVYILATQVSSEHEAQDVLDVGSKLLERAEDDVCDALNFQRRITEAMLNKVAAAASNTDAASVELRGDIICGVGLRSCEGRCVPEIAPPGLPQRARWRALSDFNG